MSIVSSIPSEWFLRTLEERQPRKDFLCVLRKRDTTFNEALKTEANGYGPSPEAAVDRAVEVISKNGPKAQDKQFAAAEAVLQEDDEILANLANVDIDKVLPELGPDGSLPPWEIGQRVRSEVPNVEPNPTVFTVRTCLMEQADWGMGGGADGANPRGRACLRGQGACGRNGAAGDKHT
jgi:hypothetical protein